MGPANISLNYDPTDPDKMRLPVGTTCGECRHIYRCKSIFGHTETDTYCDWSPSRFSAGVKVTASRTYETSSTKLPTQSGRKALLKIAAGRPVQGGFVETMESLRRRGLIGKGDQLTEAGQQMVARLTTTPEVSHG